MWAGAVLALCLCTSAATAACKVNQIGEIHVRMDGNQPLMEGEINGKPVDMLADTGAGASLLFHGSVTRLGLTTYELEGTKFYGIGGEAVASKTNIDTMKLGSLSTRNLSLYVVGRDAKSDSMTAGLLGADFFSQADIEFDLAHHVIRFLKPQGCKSEEVLYWPGAFSELPLVDSSEGYSRFAVEVKLNGHSTLALLDTGAFRSIVTLAGARAAGISVASLKPVEGKTFGVGPGAVARQVATFDSFTFDQETIKSVPIEVADLFHANKAVPLGSRLSQAIFDDPDMLLGADFFLSHRVLISQSQHMVFVTYNGGKVFEAGDAPKASPPKP